MFVDSLRDIREMDICEAEFQKEAAEEGIESFMEAMNRVCGRHTAEDIEQVAVSGCERADMILGHMEERKTDAQIDREWEDSLWLMMECHMVCTCALEMVKHIGPNLHRTVDTHAARMRSLLERAFDINLQVIHRWKKSLN